ncbi:hypothetical protein NDU88_006050 [Pleurodeles waltl]|uniref:Uncharacterized protein n=1 Tax=Pleurodeles waltl TaxID=8319 RepID=A0AAV7RQ51_PLEWA|nr:hypothetical protein NDU88_006050 [Pleurodeles waltl]
MGSEENRRKMDSKWAVKKNEGRWTTEEEQKNEGKWTPKEEQKTKEDGQQRKSRKRRKMDNRGRAQNEGKWAPEEEQKTKEKWTERGQQRKTRSAVFLSVPPPHTSRWPFRNANVPTAVFSLHKSSGLFTRRARRLKYLRFSQTGRIQPFCSTSSSHLCLLHR